jgi:hypothetical protein
MKVLEGLDSIVNVKRIDVVRARVTKKEKEQVTQFAKSAKVTESDVIRYALLQAKVITK